MQISEHVFVRERKVEFMTRILVIDDDELLRQLLRDTLEQVGYEVVEAPNGREGLERFRTMRMDLVITDLTIPEKDGLETIKELRHDSPHVKIIAISGGGQSLLVRASQLGAQRVLHKPFHPWELVEAVGALVTGPTYAATV
jgi:DNA-binding response OmpR family regulator